MDFNLSPEDIKWLTAILSIEFMLALVVFISVLHTMLKKDHRLLKSKLEEQSRQIKNLSQESDRQSPASQEVIRLSGLLDKAGKESASFKLQWTQEQHARKSLEKEVDFQRSQIANLESYRTLYNTLRTAMGTQARYQENINSQIISETPEHHSVANLVRQSQQGNKALLDLVGEGGAMGETESQAMTAGGSERVEESVVTDDSGMEREAQGVMPAFPDELFEDQTRTISVLQEKLSRGEFDVKTLEKELNQVEDLLENSNKEIKRLRQELMGNQQGKRELEALNNTLFMTRARVSILESDKRRLVSEKQDMLAKIELLESENKDKYTRMISLAKQLAKGGPTNQNQEAFKLKKKLTQVEEDLAAKTDAYRGLQREFTELETMYLKMFEQASKGKPR